MPTLAKHLHDPPSPSHSDRQCTPKSQELDEMDQSHQKPMCVRVGGMFRLVTLAVSRWRQGDLRCETLSRIPKVKFKKKLTGLSPPCTSVVPVGTLACL